MVKIAKMPTQAGKLRRRSADKSIAVLIQQYRVQSGSVLYLSLHCYTNVYTDRPQATCEPMPIFIPVLIGGEPENCTGVNGIILRTHRSIFAIVRGCFPLLPPGLSCFSVLVV